MSLEKIQELLNKHKLVEGMVHSQHMTRQNIVETLVHRQHLTEIEILLGKLSAREIADIIESMTVDDAKLVWGTIPELRKNDLLWELADSIREQVTGILEPNFSDSEINAFELVNGKLTRITVSCRKDLEGLQPIWIDLICTNQAERNYVGGFFGLELPDPGDVTDLEVSNRFQVKENDDIHLHSNFLLDKYDHSRSVPVAFVLHQGILFSLRNEELPVFRLQRQRARTRPGYVTDNFDVLIDLYGADVEYSADSLEDIYRTLSKVGKQVLSEKMSDQEAATVLADIAEEEDLNGQIRSNILDTQRALGFLMQSRVLSKRQANDIKQILRNIESLNSHTAFLFDKINFLMDATIGFININQNGRVNQLTVLGVVFMPINILAGIGGMSEFSMMTEGIPWPFAYSAFIVSMALIGWGTFVGLKHVENRKIKQASNGKGRK
jgi:magnesium transporter